MRCIVTHCELVELVKWDTMSISTFGTLSSLQFDTNCTFTRIPNVYRVHLHLSSLPITASSEEFLIVFSKHIAAYSSSVILFHQVATLADEKSCLAGPVVVFQQFISSQYTSTVQNKT